MIKITDTERRIIGEITDRHRRENGITYGKFAAMVGVSDRRVVENWRSGRNAPAVDLLITVAAHNRDAGMRAWAAACLNARGLPVPEYHQAAEQFDAG